MRKSFGWVFFCLGTLMFLSNFPFGYFVMGECSWLGCAWQGGLAVIGWFMAHPRKKKVEEV